jgi:CDP-diacylglycerol---glycerol-3-phosphate 3-phosphatidyltransferase
MEINLPNILSFIRILISPIILILLISENMLYVKIGCILFVVGSITDYIDGWIARKYKSESNSGKFLDPLADKFLTASAFIAFFILKIVAFWMIFIILLRDITNTLLKFYANQIKHPIITMYSAKVKTTIEMIVITYILVLLFIKDWHFSILPNGFIFSLIYSPITYILMLILTLLTVWTFIQYIINNLTVISLLFNIDENKLKNTFNSISDTLRFRTKK